MLETTILKTGDSIWGQEMFCCPCACRFNNMVYTDTYNNWYGPTSYPYKETMMLHSAVRIYIGTAS